MTKKEKELWRKMGVVPRGIRALAALNEARKREGRPEVTTRAVDDLIAERRKALGLPNP